MKKLVSLLLVLTLALALAAPAGAYTAQEDASLGIIGGADGPTAIITAGIGTGEETDEQLAALQEQMREAAIQLLGGKPGEVNVLLNDRCVPFTGAAPEIRDGRTMVPMRAAVESMGAAVGYDPASHTASVENGTLRFTHAIGTDTIVLDDGTQVKMDVASYIKNGYTMVPVRFFSQVLGYDVFWDSDHRMVFLLDKESWIKSVDAYFTVLNGYLARSAKPVDRSGGCCEEMKLSGTVRLIDSINGNRSYPYSVETRSLVGQTGMSIHAAFELGELMSMLEGLAYDSLPVAYRELFSSFTFNALYGDKLYLQSPVLDALVGGEELAGAWYALSDVDYSAFYRSLYSGEGCTIGALCYAMMEQGDANHFFDSWNGATAIASTLVELMGDATFTKSGSSDKWHFGIEELAAFVNSAVGEESCTASDLREAGVDALSIDMTLRADGSVDLKLALELSQEQQTMLRADCTVKGTESGSTVKGSVQVRNVCDVTFNGAMAVRTMDEEIAAVPPAGAVVIDLGPMADLQTAV